MDNSRRWDAPSAEPPGSPDEVQEERPRGTEEEPDADGDGASGGAPAWERVDSPRPENGDGRAPGSGVGPPSAAAGTPTDRSGQGERPERRESESAEGGSSQEARSLFQEVKDRVHRQLLERLNLSNLSERNEDQAIEETRKIVRSLLVKEQTPLNLEERERLVEEVLNEVFGLGPLEPLLRDSSISDILVNTYDQVYVERDGMLEETDVSFRDDRHLMQVIDRIVSGVGRRIDDSQPMVDARLPDGSRVNAIIPPLAIDGPHLSVRKFRSDVLSADDLVRNGTLTQEMLDLLQACVKAELNILISGGTGAGKTTLLNVLSESIPHTERIVTIEDSAELQLRQPHVVRLETRPPNVEGSGEVGQRQLLINALRMRPDRIVVGEVRGAEAVDMLQAMNTGHDGSLTTLHANSPRDALRRLETMIQMASLNLAQSAMRQQIASAIDLVVQATRLPDGSRRVMTIAEVVGMEGEVITMQDLYTFERQGITSDGKVKGEFGSTGIRPQVADKLRSHGISLGDGLDSALDFERAGGFR